MSEEARERFFGQSLADTLITIESRWYARVRDCTIYRYAFEEDLFEPMMRRRGIIFPPGLTFPWRLILRSSFQSFGIHRFHQAVKP
ncbi:hypothetical protein J27TS7_22990 [Paenibacillus dendritiformis]|nr:DUF6886 family protein [Paenibacillus dendritiformis]GIO72785.1 hypothetical protein J27TS7_22990 [Paenibacillus dendritiformis]